MAVINVKVISDVVCPFCFLGKKRFEQAISLYKRTVPGAADDHVVVSWLPFYLDPSAPKPGIPVNEHIANKFGADRVAALNARMGAMGEKEGIHFTFDGKFGNTRDAHRLVQLAKKKEAELQAQAEAAAAAANGAERVTPSENADAAPAAESTPPPPNTELENALMDSLFRSYFEESGDVTSHKTLVAAAERAGIDGAEARAWLESSDDNTAGGAVVDAEVKDAARRGVHGVPHFIINDTIEVSGAQDVHTFVGQLARARQAA